MSFVWQNKGLRKVKPFRQFSPPPRKIYPPPHVNHNTMLGHSAYGDYGEYLNSFGYDASAEADSGEVAVSGEAKARPAWQSGDGLREHAAEHGPGSVPAGTRVEGYTEPTGDSTPTLEEWVVVGERYGLVWGVPARTWERYGEDAEAIPSAIERPLTGQRPVLGGGCVFAASAGGERRMETEFPATPEEASSGPQLTERQQKLLTGLISSSTPFDYGNLEEAAALPAPPDEPADDFELGGGWGEGPRTSWEMSGEEAERPPLHPGSPENYQIGSAIGAREDLGFFKAAPTAAMGLHEGTPRDISREMAHAITAQTGLSGGEIVENFDDASSRSVRLGLGNLEGATWPKTRESTLAYICHVNGLSGYTLSSTDDEGHFGVEFWENPNRS